MLANSPELLMIGQLSETINSVVIGIGYLLCISGFAFLCIGVYQAVVKLIGKVVPLFLISCVLAHGSIDLAVGLTIVRLFQQESLLWTTLILVGLVAYSISSNLARRWYMNKAQVLVDTSSSPSG